MGVLISCAHTVLPDIHQETDYTHTYTQIIHTHIIWEAGEQVWDKITILKQK